MDALYNIQEEILRLCISREGENGYAETYSVQSNERVIGESLHSRGKTWLPSHLKMHVSNDKKFRNSASDLIICAKNLNSNKFELSKTLTTEEVKSFLNESIFMKDIKLNEASTKVSIVLKKASTINQVLKEILATPTRLRNCDHPKNIVILFVKDYKGAKVDDVEECFGYARLMAVSTHLKKIFELNGRQCYLMVDQGEKLLYEEVQDIFPDTSCTSTIETNPNTTLETFAKKAQGSKYRLGTMDERHAIEDAVDLDFQTYLTESGFQTGRNGLDKSLRSFTVVKSNGEVTNCLKTAAIIESSASEAISDSKAKASLLMVSPTQRRWEAQMSSICWHMLSSHRENIESMALCCCGKCSPKYTSDGKYETVTFKDYIRLKSIEIRESYVSRYGAEVQGGDWDKVISDVATACIKLDLLSSPLRNTVHLSVNTDGSQVTSSRGSIFVLYNYSRLCTLLRKYEDELTSGKYPPLPNIDEVDFSNLREEQEWRIFTKYILSYPILINDLVEAISDSENFQLNPPINKIASFLSNMSHDLSSYYHQTKVLLDPMPHLFPLMFARIYFIKALEKVMQNAFTLIGINPPAQM